MKSAPPHFFIVGYYGHSLAGDEAILDVLVRDLRVRWPGCRLCVTSDSPAETSENYQVEAVSLSDLAAIISMVSRCDMVILGGGGLYTEYSPFEPLRSFSDRASFTTLCSELPAFARAKKVPCVIFSAGVETSRTENSRQAIRRAFTLATAACVRDSTSLAALRALGEPTIAPMVTCDPASRLEPESMDREATVSSLGLDPARPLLTLSLRHWDIEPLRLSESPQPWEQEVRAALADFSRRGGQLLAVPHQLGGGWAFSDDRPLYERLFADLESQQCAIWNGPTKPRLVASLQALGTAHLAMRHHGVIFSEATCTPCGALAYSPKVAGAMSDAGLQDYCLDLPSVTAAAVTALVRKLFDDAPSISKRLASNAIRCSKAHEHALDLIQSEIMLPSDRTSPQVLEALISSASNWLDIVSTRTLGGILSDSISAIVRSSLDHGEDPAALAPHLRELATAWPLDASLQYYLGFAELHQRNFPEAIQAYTRALEQGFPAFWALTSRAEAYIHQGNLEAAEADVANARSSSENDTRVTEIMDAIAKVRSKL